MVTSREFQDEAFEEAQEWIDESIQSGTTTSVQACSHEANEYINALADGARVTDEWAVYWTEAWCVKIGQVPVLPDVVVSQLRDEAVAAGDDDTAVDCDLILAGDVSPGDIKYDAASVRLAFVIVEAADADAAAAAADEDEDEDDDDKDEEGSRVMVRMAYRVPCARY